MSEIDDLNHRAQAEGRHHQDQWDAYMVESLRQLGRETGQQKTYDKRAQKYLAERGY